MRDFRVRLDGREIGRIDGGQRALKQGQSFQLPDGSTLTIRLQQTMMVDELQVLRNGQPLPGSAGNPATKLTAGVRAAFFWGLGALAAGLLIQFLNLTLLVQLAFSPYSIAFGALLMVTAVAISQYSQLAAIVALLLFVADLVVGIWFAGANGIALNFLTTAAILVRVLSLVPFWQAIGAVQALAAANDNR